MTLQILATQLSRYVVQKSARCLLKRGFAAVVVVVFKAEAEPSLHDEHLAPYALQRRLLVHFNPSLTAQAPVLTPVSPVSPYPRVNGLLRVVHFTSLD